MKPILTTQYFRKAATALAAMALYTMSAAQSCDPKALLQKPGIWKNGMPGSLSGVPATSLPTERKVTAQLKAMLKQHYAPRGLEAVVSEAYERVYPDMIVHPCHIAVYFMDWYCNGGKTVTAHETSTTVHLIANRTDIAYTHDVINGFIDEADKDHYGWLDRMPVLKDGAWYMEEELKGITGVSVKTMKWFITYEGKLPFSYVTRKEYLERLRSMSAKLRDKELKSNQENYGNKKERLEKANSMTNKLYNGQITTADHLLKTMSAEELKKVAIVPKSGEFSAFMQEGDYNSTILIREDAGYYNKKLSPAVPQHFLLYWTLDEKAPVFAQAYTDIMQAISIPALRKMLGKVPGAQ